MQQITTKSTKKAVAGSAAVLGIFLAEVEAARRGCSLDAHGEARFGAVSFVHRFGSALNAQCILMKCLRAFHPSGRSTVPICSRQIGHCCVLDGVFSAAAEGLRFHPAFLTDAAIAHVRQRSRRRVLFLRRAVLLEEGSRLKRPFAIGCHETHARVGPQGRLIMMHFRVHHPMGGLQPCKSAVLPICP